MSSPNGPLPHPQLPHPDWCHPRWCNTARGGPHRGERFALEDVGSSPVVVQVEQVAGQPAAVLVAFLRPTLFTVTFTLPGADEVGGMLRSLASSAGVASVVADRRVVGGVGDWTVGR